MQATVKPAWHTHPTFLEPEVEETDNSWSHDKAARYLCSLEIHMSDGCQLGQRLAVYGHSVLRAYPEGQGPMFLT